MTTNFTRYIYLPTYILLILSIPLLIISSTVYVYSHSVAIYKAGFEKYNISHVTGISNIQLGQVAEQMVDYFGGERITPQLTVDINGEQQPVYNEKELIHLKDVREIILLFTIMLIASLLIFVGMAILLYSTVGLIPLLKGIRIGAIITGTLTVVLIAWAIVDFYSLFLLFHFISFSNDLWILDPAKDYLIMMFPQGFFNDTAILMVLTILIEAAIIWTAAFVIKKALPWKLTADKKNGI
ncbi:MAG: TIGR01906 family membrane protein [Dehalococcoidia bacterium]|nr:TIGR01906 family membrane protein [Dehalococcoidia bacterium]